MPEQLPFVHCIGAVTDRTSVVEHARAETAPAIVRLLFALSIRIQLIKRGFRCISKRAWAIHPKGENPTFQVDLDDVVCDLLASVLYAGVEVCSVVEPNKRYVISIAQDPVIHHRRFPLRRRSSSLNFSGMYRQTGY